MVWRGFIDTDSSKHSVHASDTEQSGDDQITTTNEPEKFLLQWIGGFIINQRFPHKNSAPKHYIKASRGKRYCQKCKRNYWLLETFFPDDLIEFIVSCANKKIDLLRPSYKQQKDCLSTDFMELSVFIGILYMAGDKKGNHLDSKKLWALDFFPATMSRRRFHLLLQAFRFNDLGIRAERSHIDNLPPIGYVFDRFVENCSAHYTPEEYVTIDEMLDAFCANQAGKVRYKNICSCWFQDILYTYFRNIRWEIAWWPLSKFN